MKLMDKRFWIFEDSSYCIQSMYMEIVDFVRLKHTKFKTNYSMYVLDKRPYDMAYGIWMPLGYILELYMR